METITTQEDFLKRYHYDPIKDRLGAGGFGSVYKARDTILHRDVAIKIAEVKKSETGKKIFSLRDEVLAVSKLPDHPNVAHYEKNELYTFTLSNGVFDHAVMQYYPDGNLSEAMKEGLTANQMEDIARQLLEGIAFLHKHKVVHRDLKPANILIVKHGGKVTPVIIDFGLSKSVDETMFNNSFTGGTRRYSAPEQMQGGQPLKFNVDLWSYGVIVYELFTGKPLFSADSGVADSEQAEKEIFDKITKGNVGSLHKMPEKWRKIAERCLIVDSEKRVQNADELFEILDSNDVDRENVGDNQKGGVNHVRLKNYGKKLILCALGILIALCTIIFVVKHNKIQIQQDDRQKIQQDDRQEIQQKEDTAQYYQKGLKCENDGDATEAVRWYLKAAEQGDNQAQNKMGNCYFNGFGVQKDMNESFEWYRKSAEQENKYAQFNLGGMYENGYGVKQDYSKAAEWYRKSAEQGYRAAQYRLGHLYYRGYITQDYNEAAKWFKKSAELGYKEAQNSLGICYYNGYGVKQDYVEAAKWYKKAAEQDHTNAQLNLGNCYYYGYGVKQDYNEAAKWFNKAASKGSKKAKEALDKMGR